MTAESAVPAQAVKRSYTQKLWVPIVLLIGLVVGEILSLATSMETQFGRGQGPFGPFGPFHPFPTDPLFAYHVIFTTIEVALLIALVLIYSKMYVETKANFALGLVVVLAALLLQAALSYPILDDLSGPVSMQPGYWSPAADVVTICAYTVFLYLSLE